MKAKEIWTVSVRCPTCKASGIASLWQEDSWTFPNGGQSVRLESVPTGFRAAKKWPGFEFTCIKCGVPADSKNS
jgi:hypothetical protein